MVGLVGMKNKVFCPVCKKEVKGSGKYCSYEHSVVAIDEAIKQMREKEGPIYEKWKQRLKAAIGTL